jgi:hypothetical protein
MRTITAVIQKWNDGENVRLATLAGTAALMALPCVDDPVKQPRDRRTQGRPLAGSGRRLRTAA